MTGSFYIVATPIGNLEDISARAIRVLQEVNLILTEDTRVTSKLLMHFGIKKDILSYHQQSADNKKLDILNILMSGRDIALVTDAGTPGISDPGNELISFLTNQEIEIKVIPIPGPSSLTAALSVCGFNVANFLFIGFWPKKKAKKLIDLIRTVNQPIVFFEAPYRIIKTIDLLISEFGEDKRIFVARELTKMYETLYRGTLREVKGKLMSDTIKGEIVCVFDKVLS